MPTISIYFSESEYNLVSQYIKNKGLTISQYIKGLYNKCWGYSYKSSRQHFLL